MLTRQKHVLSQSTTPFACTLRGAPESLEKVSKRSFRDRFETFFQTLETFSRLLSDSRGGFRAGGPGSAIIRY